LPALARAAGSVAQGEAIAGVSDLDLHVFARHVGAPQQRALHALEQELQRQYSSLCTAIDRTLVLVGSTPACDIISALPRHSRTYTANVLHFGRLVCGSDLRPEMHSADTMHCRSFPGVLAAADHIEQGVVDARSALKQCLRACYEWKESVHAGEAQVTFDVTRSAQSCADALQTHYHADASLFARAADLLQRPVGQEAARCVVDLVDWVCLQICGTIGQRFPPFSSEYIFSVEFLGRTPFCSNKAAFVSFLNRLQGTSLPLGRHVSLLFGREEASVAQRAGSDWRGLKQHVEKRERRKCTDRFKLALCHIQHVHPDLHELITFFTSVVVVQIQADGVYLQQRSHSQPSLQGVFWLYPSESWTVQIWSEYIVHEYVRNITNLHDIKC
jgi:hypothetical protein